jgi:GrpB-like predicted nucleotidyltransferase (UPF0157 family)
VDERINIEPYSVDWPNLFTIERALLESVLAPWLTGPIEHVGSTAVPGLAAKPIIDMMAAVGGLELSRGAVPALEHVGYCYAPYRQEVMHWFCRPTPSHRTHHLHLVPYLSPLWNERLIFRDRLRSDRRVADEYADLKRHLAEIHQNDREAYTEAKGSFIKRVVRGAA